MTQKMLTNQDLRSFFRVLIQLLTVWSTICLCDPNITWIVTDIGQVATASNSASWGSVGLFTCGSQKAILVQSSSNASNYFIEKTFTGLPPHAFITFQATSNFKSLYIGRVFEIGTYLRTESFQVLVDDSEKITRYATSNSPNQCISETDSLVTQVFGANHDQGTLTLKFQLSEPGLGKILAINNFFLGIVPCPPGCTRCGFSSFSGLPAQLVCYTCPANSTLQINNSCLCNVGYGANHEFGYLVCIEAVIPAAVINAIPQAVVDLTAFATNTRVQVRSSLGLEGATQVVLTSVIMDQFFGVLDPNEQALLRTFITQYNTQQAVYINIAQSYFRNVVRGSLMSFSVPVSEIIALNDYFFQSNGKYYYEDMYAVNIYVGETLARQHRFKIVYTFQGNQEPVVSAFNTDISKNMNVINSATYTLHPVFQQEFLYEIKGLLCADTTCSRSRAKSGYQLNDQVIMRVGFQSSQTTLNLSVENVFIYPLNQQIDMSSSMTYINPQGGKITMTFPQTQVFVAQFRGQAQNKIQLQVLLSYSRDNNPANGKRYAQVIITYYSNRPGFTRILHADSEHSPFNSNLSL